MKLFTYKWDVRRLINKSQVRVEHSNSMAAREQYTKSLTSRIMKIDIYKNLKRIMPLHPLKLLHLHRKRLIYMQDPALWLTDKSYRKVIRPKATHLALSTRPVTTVFLQSALLIQWVECVAQKEFDNLSDSIIQPAKVTIQSRVMWL